MKKNSISVVIPCFNESRTIYKNIEKIKDYLEKRFSRYEIIAVNDGSADDTWEELERLRKELGIFIINKRKNEGKGRAVKDGVAASRFDFVLFLDADLAIPIEELAKFMDEAESGTDMVIASRFVPGLKIIKPVLWYRKIMERTFRLIRMVIINNYQVKDTQCGFKLFHGKCARKIFPSMRINRFAFDAEIVFIACKLNFKIKELPISLQNPKRTSVRIVSDSLNMLLDLIKIRWNDLNNVYASEPAQKIIAPTEKVVEEDLNRIPARSLSE
ncbi:MAG: glycosyltransferase [Nitrospirota bacterium]